MHICIYICMFVLSITNSNMKYRIKITTFQNGRKEFNPYVKVWGLWFGINYSGKQHLDYSVKCDSRDEALKVIDKHYKRDCKKQTIDFEYIKR